MRHPIYSGILVAGIGTAVALGWLWLIAIALAGIYFVYSATVEERYMAEPVPGHLSDLQAIDEDARAVRLLTEHDSDERRGEDSDRQLLPHGLGTQAARAGERASCTSVSSRIGSITAW